MKRKKSQKPKLGTAQSPSNLPEEIIITEILTRLPVKALIRFKCVSKEWLSVISSPKFAKSHLDRSNQNPFSRTLQSFFIYSGPSCKVLNCSENGNPNYEDEIWDIIQFNGSNGIPEAYRVVGSCNGLVCFHVRCLGSFRIWNPYIDQYYDVPGSHLPVPYGLGFGYVSSDDDYRIINNGVVARKYMDGTIEKSTYVYSLRANEWKKIDGVPKNLGGPNQMIGNGVLVGEKLYWSGISSVIGFDLKDDTFHEVSNDSWGLDFGCDGLSVLNGSLCAWGCRGDDEVEFWMLDTHAGSGCWCKFLKLDGSWYDMHITNFYGFTRSGKLFVQGRRTLQRKMDIRLRDTNVNRGKYVSSVSFDGLVISFVESLISPLHFVKHTKYEGRLRRKGRK